MKAFFKTVSLLLALAPASLFAQTTDALFIDRNGNVGIGVPAPTHMLDVGGNIALRGTHIIFNSQEGVINWGNSNGGHLRFRHLSTQGADNTYDGKELMLISDAGNVNVYGSMTAASVKDNTGYVTPKGGIIMWSGAGNVFDGTGKGMAGTAVEGWAICNGQNNTIDLRDRFIVGVGPGYTLGAKGGRDNVTLTTNEMPSHNHEILMTCFKGAGEWNNVGPSSVMVGDHGGYYANTAKKGWADCGQPSTEGKTFVKESGNGAAFDNRPQYYALYYIMKL